MFGTVRMIVVDLPGQGHTGSAVTIVTSKLFVHKD